MQSLVNRPRKISRLAGALNRFHRDVRGDGGLTVILMLCVAVLVLVGIMAVAGISNSGQPSSDSGIFGALAELLKIVLSGYK